MSLRELSRSAVPGTTRPVMLVIGTQRDWARADASIDKLDWLHFALFEQLDSKLMAKVSPELVVSRLFEHDFDAVDVARQLHQLGFRGRYLTLCDDLPRPELVRREIAAAAPGLGFEIVSQEV